MLESPPFLQLRWNAQFPIPPSCIVSSGRGVHIYWLLEHPTTDRQTVNVIHHGIAQVLKGDYLTAATSLRLPGSRNTKNDPPAVCEVLESDWSRRHNLTEFAAYQKAELEQQAKPPTGQKSSQNKSNTSAVPNPRLIQEVTKVLLSQGFKWRETWLNGSCFRAHQHKHQDRRPSFGFNTATGYGYCFVCGSVLLKDVCYRLGIDTCACSLLIK